MVLAVVIAGWVGFEDSTSAHDGGNGVISWADIHRNTSGTGVWENDFYYTGHESCSGNDACSFYTQFWACRFVPGVRACSLQVDLYHATVHSYQYDHSVPSLIGSSQGLCWSLTHYDGWDCHQTTGVQRYLKT